MPDVAETSLEQTFVDLAHARLRDKCPSLLEYEIGAELRDHDDDGSKATLLMGFEVGGAYYYAPFWFLNGEVKGPFALYSVNDDLFVPMTDDMVNKIIEKQENRLGDADKKSRQERGVRNPDYVRLRQLPSGSGGQMTGVSLFSKQASVDALVKMAGQRTYAWSTLAEFLADLHPDVAVKTASAIWGPAVQQFYPEMSDLGLRLNKRAWATPDDNYDPDWTDKDMGTPAYLYWRGKTNDRAAGAAYKERLKKDQAARLNKRAADESKPKLVIVSQLGGEGSEQLSDKERANVVSGGVGITDRRPDVEKSKVYGTETAQILQTPTAGGLYEVLLSTGEVSPMLCLQVPAGDRKHGMFVFEPESGRHAFIRPRVVKTVRQESMDRYRTEIDKATTDADSVRRGDCVMWVNQKGEASVPFVIRELVKGIDGIVTAKVERAYHVPAVEAGAHAMNWAPVGISLHGLQWVTPCPSERTTEVVISDAGGSDPRYTASRLVINRRNFRALILNKAKLDGDYIGYDYEEPCDKIHFRASDFGDHDTVRQQLEKIAYEIKMWTTDYGVVIRGPEGSAEMSKTAALISLVRDHGLGREDAERLVKQASHAPERWMIKRAAMSDLLTQQEPIDTTDGGLMSNYHPSQVPITLVNKKSPDDNRDFYRYHSPFGGGEDSNDGGSMTEGQKDRSKPDDTMQVLDQAAKTGQKEVFDAAAIGSLIKTKRAPEMVERYLPTISSGMDRIGRLLFLTYQHYDDFKDKYGEQDIADLVENLETVFEQLGDLVCFLQKQTLSGDPSSHGLGLASTPLES